MRLYFAAESSKEQSLELLYAYRKQCFADLEEMDEANELFRQVDLSTYKPEEIQYLEINYATWRNDEKNKT